MWRLSVFKIINVNCISPDLKEQVKFLLSSGGSEDFSTLSLLFDTEVTHSYRTSIQT